MIRPLLSVLAIALFAQGTLAAPCGGDFSRIHRRDGRRGYRGWRLARGGFIRSQWCHAGSRRARFRSASARHLPSKFRRFRGGPGDAHTCPDGADELTCHAGLLSRIERRFGVPAPLLVAIWGLESDYGTGDTGRMPVPRTLATLAHDCRRTEMFQGELLAALRIIQRRDLSPDEMLGAWAGEIGQTQFLPSSYLKYGVDFDGDGRVDLRHSVPDVLASTANLIRTNGWRPGESWGEGTANFEVLREWNHADLYRRTLVVFAARLTEP